jgi:hypothetical protein
MIFLSEFAAFAIFLHCHDMKTKRPNMKKNLILAFMASLLLVTSCNFDDGEDSYYTLNTSCFNIGYCRLSSISGTFLDSLDAIVVSRILNSSEAYYYNSESRNLTNFADMCAKYADTTYDKSRTYTLDQLAPAFIADEFDTVKVTAVTNYDASHPAGSDMGDIVTINTCSEYPFISSHYKTTHDWSTIDESDIWGRWYSKSILMDNYQSPVLKLLKDIKPHDLAMIGGKLYYGANMPFCILHFNSKPTGSNTQTFSIEFNTDDNPAITYDCQVTGTFK